MMVRGESRDVSANLLALVILLAGLGLAYFIWPTGLLIHATFQDLLRMIASSIVGIAAVWVAISVWLD